MEHYIAHCKTDWKSFDRHVYVTQRLKTIPSGQCGVNITHAGRVIQLVSYETIVAEIDDGWLHVYGLFSMTTRHHIAAFQREYAPGLFYADARACFDTDTEINIVTRELRSAAAGMIQTVGLRHAV